MDKQEGKSPPPPQKKSYLLVDDGDLGLEVL